MDVRDYLRILRKGWASILAFVVVGIGIGVGLTLMTTKVYQANVTLVSENAMRVQGCVLGVLCKSQTWTRAD